jgi:type IV pilus biogenesis protein CpaD/CtpE
LLSEIEKRVLLFAGKKKLVRRSELTVVSSDGSAREAAASLVSKKLLQLVSPLGEASYTPTQAGERMLAQLQTS